jgi:hypothetical protein
MSFASESVNLSSSILEAAMDNDKTILGKFTEVVKGVVDTASTAAMQAMEPDPKQVAEETNEQVYLPDVTDAAAAPVFVAPKKKRTTALFKKVKAARAAKAPAKKAASKKTAKKSAAKKSAKKAVKTTKKTKKTAKKAVKKKKAKKSKR